MVSESGLSVGVVVLMVVGVLANLALLWYTRRRGTHPISGQFARLILVVGAWTVVYLAEMLSPSDELALVWMPLEVFIAVLSPVAFFLFVVAYTADDEWLPSWVGSLLVGEALLYWGLWVTNPLHGLVLERVAVARFGVARLPYEVLGPVALVQVLFIYLVLAASFGLLARFVLGTRNLYRKQAAVIFVATFGLVVGNLVFLLGYSPHPRLDLTPLFYTLQAGGIAVALYRYDFLDVVPLAASTLLAEMADPVIVTDADGRVVTANTAAAGLSSATVEGEHVGELPFLDVEDVETAGGEFMVKRDGRLVTYDVQSTPVADQHGAVRGYILSLRDITAQKRRERTLKQQNAHLERFAHVVSHDLRNPLSVVQGYVDLARETGDIGHLDRASEAADRMEERIDGLLSLAREGRTIDEVDDVPLAAAARSAWRHLDTGTASLEVDTERTLRADRARLEQALQNLFENAVEHGGDGVTVTVGDRPDGFFVSDTGSGIPSAVQEDVFEFGYSTDEGTGFGLAITESIVAAHGWELRLADTDGGTRFDVLTAASSRPRARP